MGYSVWLAAVMYGICYGNEYYRLFDFFRYGVKRDHYEKFIDIREFLEQLDIALTIIFHLIEGPQQRSYPPLTRSIMEIQFRLAVQFIFTVLILPPQRSELLLT